MVLLPKWLDAGYGKVFSYQKSPPSVHGVAAAADPEDRCRLT
jgi:hypothetical protein